MRLKKKRIGKESFDVLNLSLNKTADRVCEIGDCVLIVGRHYETRLLLKTLLELWEYRTIESPTVGRAENVAGFFPPKLILLDTDSSFAETLENIFLIRKTNLFSALPLIVISGYTQPHFRDLSIKSGADVYLTKPLNFAKMERIMKKLVDGENTADGDLL